MPIDLAPSGTDLEVGVMDNGDIHTLVFPVRKNGQSWTKASTQERIDIQPTHWRKWSDRR